MVAGSRRQQQFTAEERETRGKREKSWLVMVLGDDSRAWRSGGYGGFEPERREAERESSIERESVRPRERAWLRW